MPRLTPLAHLAFTPARPTLGASRFMAKICLNMIVKNESGIIERCLASVLPWIDCYVICDTGSTDATPEVIRTFFARHGVPGEIHAIDFVHFEYARNRALELCRAAPLAFDYILLTDADMEARRGRGRGQAGLACACLLHAAIESIDLLQHAHAPAGSGRTLCRRDARIPAHGRGGGSNAGSLVPRSRLRGQSVQQVRARHCLAQQRPGTRTEQCPQHVLPGSIVPGFGPVSSGHRLVPAARGRGGLAGGGLVFQVHDRSVPPRTGRRRQDSCKAVSKPTTIVPRGPNLSMPSLSIIVSNPCTRPA